MGYYKLTFSSRKHTIIIIIIKTNLSNDVTNLPLIILHCCVGKAALPPDRFGSIIFSSNSDSKNILRAIAIPYFPGVFPCNSEKLMESPLESCK